MGIGNGMKSMKLPSPGGGGGKWAAIAVVAASPLAIFFIVPVILMLIIGITVSVVTGSTAAMLGSDEVQHGGSGCMVGGVTGNQTQHVRTVIGVAKALGVSKKGAIIATMTMMAETGIQNIANDGKRGPEDNGMSQEWLDVAALSMNYPHDLYNGTPAGSDHDSIGLFQQRVSGSWATLGDSNSSNDPEAAVQRLLNPVWTAQAFFGGDKSPPSRPGMLEIAPDYESRADWGSVAQDVQVSAYPDAYNRFKSQATQLVNQNWDSAPRVALIGVGDDGSDGSGDSDDSGDSSGGSSSAFTMPLQGTNEVNEHFGPRDRRFHHGVDLKGTEGTPIYAIADGTVNKVGWSPNGWGNYLVIDHRVNGKTYSSLYAHQTDGGIKVNPGDKVGQGERIGTVGWTGNVRPPGPGGAHLHLEIHEGGFDGTTANTINPWPLLQGQPPGGVEGGGCGGGGSGAPPAPFPGGDPDAEVPDPSSDGKITKRMFHLYEQTKSNYPNTGWGCYSDRGANNPTSEHDNGRACDITFGNRIGDFPDDQQKQFGWDVTNWMKDNADALGVEYLIWQGKIWSVSRDAEGWRPYNGGGMHDPNDPTGGHYDHLHVTVKEGR